MKKRRNDPELAALAKKLKKIEKKLKRRRIRTISSSSDDATCTWSDNQQKDAEVEDPTLTIGENTSNNPDYTQEPEQAACVELDNELLEILGEDPTTSIEYGNPIREEIATRFQHITTNGLDKNLRKELCEKYPIPSNASLIGAPTLNPEVKAALTEPVIKRDKLIEARQKRLAAAIACIGEALTRHLETKERDSNLLKLLMDAGRLVCDAQNNESVSRRNLSVYSLKRDMKIPLLETKIDKTLFGEQLLEALKTAKAVNRSGTELKTQAGTKPMVQKPTTSKNWRTPVAGRRQPPTQRSRVPAAPIAPQQPYPPLPPPQPPRSARNYSSRPPPPPPPPQYRQTRRRY